VAEGVETKHQADFLNTLGNIVHQGYFFGRPEPVESWLKNFNQPAYSSP
jgi:EAL domain-containing protein (putative c-di-GMP-specific phosphodiesterase class I)